jgi:rod shape determining protein RodA
MFDRRFVQYFDWGLLGLTILLGFLGIVTLYSVVTAEAQTPERLLYIKQLIWFCAGLVIMVLSLLLNYKILDRWAHTIYSVCTILLIGVLFFGKYVSGSKRWLMMGPLSVQPSELIKIAVIIILAHYYSRHAYTRGFTLRELIKPAVLVLIPFLLIVKQPDLGTAFLVFLIAGSMTIFVKIEKRAFISILGVCTVIITLFWFFLKKYQKLRILTFLNPDRDPLGAGYHIIQSKIAIGSGMLTGKGYWEAHRMHFHFCPSSIPTLYFQYLLRNGDLLGP